MMKHIACAALLAALVMTVPAFGAGIITIYDNGAPLGSPQTYFPYAIAGLINNSKVNAVADTFTVLTDQTSLGKAQVALWFPTGAPTANLDYGIFNSCSFGLLQLACTGQEEAVTGATLTASSVPIVGTDGFTGYSLGEFTFSLRGLQLNAGTYWLELMNASGTPPAPGYYAAYWDTNGGFGGSGPSGAVYSGQEMPLALQGIWGNNLSQSFQIYGVPEPAAVTLTAAGLLLLAGIRRRRARR
jgi:hypothetical protein